MNINQGENLNQNHSRNSLENTMLFSQSMQNFHITNYSPVPIEIPEGGIPLENVFLNKSDESILENIICPICQNLIWNIVECKDCGAFFCKFCLDLSLKSKNSCPMCRTFPFKMSQSKGLKKFFRNIKIKCSNKKCKQKIEYSDYINHLEKCPFKLYQCNNEGCNQKDILTDIKIHSGECKYRMGMCKFCNNKTKEYLLEDHIKNECNQTIDCPLCHKTMTRGFYNSKHSNNNNVDCLKGQVEYYKTKSNKLKQKYNKYQLSVKNHDDKLEKEINDLKEVVKQKTNEIKVLKEELSEWNNSFQDIYNRLIIDKKPKKEEEEVKENPNRTFREEKKNNQPIDLKSYDLQFTPKNNKYKNPNYFTNNFFKK